jgi:ligand-binding sensor domain-containing protein
VDRPQTLQSNPGYLGVEGIICAADGSVWVGIAKPGKGGGLQHLVNGTLKPFLAPKLNGETLTVSALFGDHQDNLWVGTLHGLYEIRGKNVDLYDTAEGLSDDVVRNICEDRASNVWTATSGGLDMFRDLSIKSIATREAPSVEAVESVSADRNGRVLIGRSRLQVLEPGGRFVDRAGHLWMGMDNKLFFTPAEPESRWLNRSRRGGDRRIFTNHHGSSQNSTNGPTEIRSAKVVPRAGRLFSPLCNAVPGRTASIF